MLGGETIPKDIAAILKDAANCSLAYKTWAGAKTVIRLISRCEKETGVSLQLPWSKAAMATFVGWCIRRDMRDSTIKAYTSRIRKLHTINGFNSVGSSAISRAAITGRQRTQAKPKSKIPVTPAVMMTLLHRLREKKWPAVKKQLIWAIASCLFVGAFRIGEILAFKSNRHVKGSTLLGSDVSRDTANIEGKPRKFIRVRLSNPKEDKAKKGAEVELFNLDGIFFNPVFAFDRWLERSRLELEENAPVFRWEDGSNVTPAEFNSLLRELLNRDLKYDEAITAHSFRAGVTSTMARLGYGEEAIKLQGRWKSDAFLRYTKLGRTSRLRDQFMLFTSLARDAERNNIGH